MSNDLLKNLNAYCKQYHTNVYDIKIIKTSLITDGSTIKNVQSTILLNEHLQFDYIAGTDFCDYKNFFDRA